MEKKQSKLRFDEDDPVGEATATPEQKAKTKSKLRPQSAAAVSTEKKLRFDSGGKTDEAKSAKPAGENPKDRTTQRTQQQTRQQVRQKANQSKSGTFTRSAAATAAGAVSGTFHREVSKYEDENVGIQAGHRVEKGAEGTVRTVSHAFYSHRLKQQGESQRLVHEYNEANAVYQTRRKMADETTETTNALSRWMQKRRIQREYAAARRAAETTAAAGAAVTTGAKAVKTGAEEVGEAGQKVAEFASDHKMVFLIILIIAVLLIVILCAASSCTVMSTAAGGAVLETSYTAEDEDILAVDAQYTAMEVTLQEQINRIESDYPDYDEYRYSLAEIGHNPFELAAYLTVVYEDYTEETVWAELVRLFAQQYELIMEETVEIRIETNEDDEEVEYEYRILTVTMTNRSLGTLVWDLGLTEDQLERYTILVQTCGNREYLFEDSIYAVASDYDIYEIPPEALTDEKFARMIAEAEKYLGYPYVWGGSSPSTGFDCSGYVSWVINNCGNGWSVGRQTANGLMNLCTIVSPSEAKPGDLIFFQGTYATSGASHVGIYVGDGMMIHCGNPIQYTSVETSYWQSHFLCFGRLS